MPLSNFAVHSRATFTFSFGLFAAFLDPENKKGRKKSPQRRRNWKTWKRRRSHRPPQVLGNKWQELISWKTTSYLCQCPSSAFSEWQEKARGKVKQIKIKMKTENRKKRENIFPFSFLPAPKTFPYTFLADGKKQ